VFVFPAFIEPEPTAIISMFIPIVGIPIIIVAFVVWHIRKLTRIEKMLKDIQEKLK
jgi:ABC-type antimicrobial peptide transport system permease subunit